MVTVADIQALTQCISKYITRECDGIPQGFEMTYAGLTAFVDYRGEQTDERVIVADVWDARGAQHPDIADVVQLGLST